MATPRTFRAYAAIALFLALAPAAPAAEQIDQGNLPEWDGGWTHVNPAGDGQAVMWQTFTPACANLTAVEIDILTVNPGRGDDVLTVEIAAPGVLLASAERFIEDGFDGLLRFEFPEAVPLVPEQLYELKVYDTGKGQFGWKYGPNTYEQGSRYVFARERPGTDWLFRTYATVEPAATKYSGGTGEPNDPYQIATAADLIALGETPEDYDKHFLLTADIDLDPNLPGREVFEKAVIAPDEDWNKEYSNFWGIPFTGVFDGNRCTISHLTIRGGDCLGLFGGVRPPGAISNLGLIAVNIQTIGATRNLIGSLAGDNWGEITGCYGTGTVSGWGRIGGLVGWNEGNITDSFSTCTTSGDNIVGGLVGRHYKGHITNSYSAGTVIGNGTVGGLVGKNRYEGLSTIANCYSASRVVGDASAGGLVGSGSPSNDVFNSFWDVEASGTNKSSEGTGKITAEMQVASTFLEAGWDFVGETANGTEDIWKIVEGQTYPLLSWQRYSGGTGEPNDPYQIATAADLIALGETPDDYDKHFILTADIDLDPNLPGGRVLDKAVIAPNWETPFTGVLDGNSHTISHLTITGGDYLGLFGYLGSSASVSDLGLEAVDVNGTGGNVGALVGLSSGSITTSYSSGSVNGFFQVGGLVGYSTYWGTVTQCYSSSTVSGDWNVGGLVGYTGRGSVMQCYSMGDVSGDGWVGGLVGHKNGGVMQCYSTGAVSGSSEVGGLVGHDESTHWGLGDSSSSFWDIDTSGQMTSGLGTGKTTAEMQTTATFLDAGWDFVGETANGTEDIWWIDEGKDYPRLWWEAVGTEY